MTDLYFNANGETHHLFIDPVDAKPDDITVWEAVVDNTSWTYFEAHDGIDVWELIELAVQSYLDYRVDESTELRGWRSGNG